ncbi:MAG: VCBS repeat-containing protein [Planctomycetes bacterium]|nr:VCBS repeat-containing protein [Planctomycetota bacterium]
MTKRALHAGILLLLSGRAALWAQPELSFKTLRLRADRADSLHARDLDEDGRIDLLLSAGREVKVFLNRPERGFSPDPDFVIPFAPDVYLWCLGRFADEGGLHLVTSSTAGVRRHRRGSPPEDLVICPNLFRGEAEAGVAPLHLDFMRDLNGDGLSDILLFGKDELWLFPQSKDDRGKPFFRLAQKLPLESEGELRVRTGAHRKTTHVTKVPLLIWGDANNDGRTDMISYYEQTIVLFTQGEEGKFEASGPRSLTGERPKRRNTYLKFEAPPRIADLNNDGALDIALPFPSKGRVHIYFNRSGRVDFTAPDQKMQPGDSLTTGVYVEDLNGDGKLEIVMGVVPKPGILSGIDAFLSKKIDLELHLYRLQGAGYVKDPVQILKFSVPFTFHVTRESSEIDLAFWPRFDADFDGDGLKDLLVQEDERTLVVHFGNNTRLISETAGGRIRLDPPPGASSIKTTAADLNGDGRSDLVLKYELVEQRKDVIEIKLSLAP